MKNYLHIYILITLFLVVPQARTKLTTLPPRGFVRIDLANSSQALVEEDRTINLVRGVNHVDFSWAGTQILKQSLQIRTLKAPGKVRILSTSYPPGENALFWDIWSEKSGPTKFRISYLIRGFTKKTDYLVLSTRDEKKLDVKCRVHLGNRSGESYSRAHIQLGRFFMYANRQMLNGQVRKMKAFVGKDIPLTKTYVFNQHQGRDVRFFYTFKNLSNDAKSRFGKDTLTPGKARVYIRDSEKSETFLGEDWGKAVPVGRKASLFMGLAKEIKCEYNLMKSKNEYMIQHRWYHTHQQGKWTLQNFKDEEITLTIELPMSGEWTVGKAVLKQEKGERNEKREKEISLKPVTVTRVRNGLLKIQVKLPNTGKSKIKWNLYLNWTLRNRGW